MRARFALLACLLFLWGPRTQALGQESNKASSSENIARCASALDVHVVDAITHMPIEGAFLMLNQVGAGTTGDEGHVALENVCAGNIEVLVAHERYQEGYRLIELKGVAVLEFELQPVVETFVVEVKAVESKDMRSRSVVSGEALEKKRGQALSETLSDVPGVSQVRSGTGNAKPMIRGHFGRRVPLLVDGVRHRSQDWGVDHAPEIDPAIADRIAVVRGASGVRYGSDAIGGVILVEPPRMLNKPGFASENHVVGYTNGLGGSLISRVQGVLASLPRLAFQVEGSAKRLQSAATPDYALDNTGMAEWSAGVSVVYRADRGTYQLTYRHFETKLGVCLCYRIESADAFFAQLGRQRPLNAELYRSDFEIERPYQAVSHELVMGRAAWGIGPMVNLTATYAMQYDDRQEFDVVRQSTTGPQFSFRLWTHDIDLALEHNPIHLGEHLHLSGSAGVVGMLQSHTYAGLPLVPTHSAKGGGVFAIERLWGHKYEIEAGLRYDYLNRDALIVRRDFSRLVRSEQLMPGACGALASTVDPVRCGSTFHTFSASLGGLLNVTNQWAIKLDLSMASRPPNPDEQYMNGSAPSFPVLGLGKPDARPETSYSSSATITYAGDRVSGEASGFGNFISDYLYFAPALGADGKPIFDVLVRGASPRFVTRGVDAAFYGADGTASVLPAPWLDLSAQASLVRARNLTDGGYLVLVPSDRFRVSVVATKAQFSVFQKLYASAAGSYTARQTRFDLNADLADAPDSYFLAEAALGAQTQMAGQTVKIALHGANILGRRYREYASVLRYFADQPDRQITLRITMIYNSSNKTQ